MADDILYRRCHVFNIHILSRELCIYKQVTRVRHILGRTRRILILDSGPASD